jgi:hypothetical protein
MPARMAGSQVRRMRPETSMSLWIPTFHSRMTELRSRTELTQDLHPRIFEAVHKPGFRSCDRQEARDATLPQRSRWVCASEQTSISGGARKG